MGKVLFCSFFPIPMCILWIKINYERIDRPIYRKTLLVLIIAPLVSIVYPNGAWTVSVNFFSGAL